MNPALAELQGLLIKAINCIAVDTGQICISFKTDPFVCFCVRVAPSDLGKIIGKQGNTLRALRTVVQAAGQQKGVAVRICVAEVGAL